MGMSHSATSLFLNYTSSGFVYLLSHSFDLVITL